MTQWWDTCPLGINTGGWGLSLTTETLVKFGELCLRKGVWRGRQLVPTAWIEEATAFHIQQGMDWGFGITQSGDATKRDPAESWEEMKRISDWYQGYGYQFWRCRHGAYRGDGAFGQFVIVMPDQDAVVAVTANADMQKILDLVWQHLLPSARPARLPASPAANDLVRRSKTLALPVLEGMPSMPSTSTPQRSRRTFALEPNDLGISRLSFSFSGGNSLVHLHTVDSDHKIVCGFRKWIDNIVDFRALEPTLPVVGNSVKATPYVKIAAMAAWKNDLTFEMLWRYHETPFHEIVRCVFDGDRVSISFLEGIAQRPTLKDRIV